MMDLSKLRPIQFCLFLRALVGVEMQWLMVQAIAVAISCSSALPRTLDCGPRRRNRNLLCTPKIWPDRPVGVALPCRSF